MPPMKMTEADQVVIARSTYPDKSLALQMARELVEKQLAAGAQVSGPVTSVYAWKNGINTHEEWLLDAQTRVSLLGAVQELVLAKHPYELPCFMVLPVISGFAPFMGWIFNSCKGEQCI